MKKLFLSILLCVAGVISSIGQDFTNGVFYVDAPIECRTIFQNGTITTNNLAAGKTYIVGNGLVEFESTNKTTFYFAGGPLVEVSPNSILTINVFDLEVKNISSKIDFAEFGNHNLGLTFGNGEYVVSYGNTNEYSSLSIMTPHTGKAYVGGKYVFVITEDKTTVNVIDGLVDSKNKKSPPAANKSKTKTTTELLTPEQVTKYTSLLSSLEAKKDAVQFIVIKGAVKGISMP